MPRSIRDKLLANWCFIERTLTARELRILRMKTVQQLSWEQISAALATEGQRISRERLRQIESRALAKLDQAISALQKPPRL